MSPAEQLAQTLLQLNLKLVTAESCTGGAIAACCTDLAGASAWFERGFVTYSNASKTELLGVDGQLIAQHGAVSEQVVHAMVQGALAHSHAQVAIATTGIAGPDGGLTNKPVGLVWFGFAAKGRVVCEQMHFEGTRAQVRSAAALHAVRKATLLLR